MLCNLTEKNIIFIFEKINDLNFEKYIIDKISFNEIII